MSCCALGCVNRHSVQSHLQFFRFPFSDPERLCQWVVNMRRQDWKPSQYSRLCSIHFEEHALTTDSKGNRRLKNTAVPTLFYFPPYKKKQTRRKRTILTENYHIEEERTGFEMEKSAAAQSSSVSEKPRGPDVDDLDGFPVLRAVEEDWDSSSSSKTQNSDDPEENENDKAQPSRTEESTSRNEPSASSQESGGNSREETMYSPITNIKDEPIDEGYDKALIPQSDISRIKEELENGDQELAPPPDELRISSVFSVRGATDAMSAPVAASQPPPFPTISQVTSAIKAPLMVLPAQPQTHLQAKPMAQIQLQLPPQIQSQLQIQPQPQAPPPPQLQPPAASIRICCSGCSKVLQKGQTAFQRKGSNQLFCSTVCLTGFTLPPAISIAPKKTCHLCLKVIGNLKDLITVPVDSMNTLKEFCSQACLTIYKSRVEGLNEDNIIRCSMCRKPSEIQHEVNHQGALHKLCSDECFSRFRSSKRLSISCCEICGNCTVTGNYHLVQVEDSVKKFCSPVCISTYKQKSGKRVHCPCCQEFKCVDQMLEGTNAQGVIEFFCSSRCVTNSQASRTLSGASFPCTNCQKLAIPQFHLAMPDGSIRNFCTYDCVSKFQEKLQRPSPQMNGSSIVPSTVLSNASNLGPRGPQYPNAASQPSAPPQIPNPTSIQTSIPPYVPAPGLTAPQDNQQQPNAAASAQGATRLTCKQCQKQFCAKPEILQYKSHVGLFCSHLCCETYKREKDVRATCEYCKEEKIIKDITMYEHKLRPFCCEGCKLLFKHDLAKQHGARCRVCAYCSNMTHNTIQNHFGGKLEEFCTEECMSLYTVLFYEMAKCYGCKNQGTLSESLTWDGTIKHFCNLHCILQFCAKIVVRDQPISNGTTAAPTGQAPLSLSKDMPVIGGVVSLASALAGNTALTGALPTSNASSKVIGDASTQTDASVNSSPHQRRTLKNKALMCKPIIEEQAIQCNLEPPKPLFETVVDENGEKVKLVPVPVPIPMPVYIPVPMHLYTQYTPVPVGLPLPVPVPMVVPASSAPTQHSATKSSVPSQSSVEDEDTEKSKDRPVSHGDQGSTYSGDLESEARSTPFSWADTEDSSHTLKPSVPVSQLSRPASEPPAPTSPSQLDLELDFPIELYDHSSAQEQSSPSIQCKRVKRVDSVEENLNEYLDSDSGCSQFSALTDMNQSTVETCQYVDVEYILSEDEQVEPNTSPGPQPPTPALLVSGLSSTNVEVLEGVGRRKLRTKQQFCVYCKKPNTKLARHLERQHANKPAVAKALRLPKGSEKRHFLLEQLCKQGNYQHNIHVLQKGNGEIVSKKRPKMTKSAMEYLPCQYCLAFFISRALAKHERSCRIKMNSMSCSNMQELDTMGFQSRLETFVQPTISEPSLESHAVQISESGLELLKPASLESCNKSDLTQSPKPIHHSAESYIPPSHYFGQPLSPESCYQLRSPSNPEPSLEPDLEFCDQAAGAPSPSSQRSPCPSPESCHQIFFKTFPETIPQSNQEESPVRSDVDHLHTADSCHQSSSSSNPGLNPQSGFETLLQFVENCTLEIDSHSKSGQKTNSPEASPQMNQSSVDSCLPPSVRSSTDLDTQLYPESSPSPGPTSVASLNLQEITQASSEDNLPASPESSNQDSVELSPQPASSPQPRPKPNTELSLTDDNQKTSLRSCSTYNLRSKSKPMPKVSPSADKLGNGKHGLDPHVSDGSECNHTDDQQVSFSMTSDNGLDRMRPLVEDISVSSSKMRSTSEINRQSSSPSSPVSDQESVSNCNTSSNTAHSQKSGQKWLKQKKHFCVYCKKSLFKIARHLLHKHKNEADVVQAFSFPKGSKERRLLFEQLRNKGNYQHNIDVLRQGSEEIIPKCRRRNKSMIHDYLPCQYCLAFFLRNTLLRHERSCNLKYSHPCSDVLQRLDTESNNQSRVETCTQPTSESSPRKSRSQPDPQSSFRHSRGSSPGHSRGSSPGHSSGSSPRHSRGSSPGHISGSSPRHSRESSPRQSRESSPRQSRESSPRQSRESSPRQSRESSPRQSRESSPRQSRESSPRQSRESSPRHSRESSPRHSRESSPRHSRESSPRHSRESSPRHSRESSPQHSRESSPRHSRESSPRHSRESSPRHSRESSPGHSRGSSPGHSRGSSPGHSRESSPRHSRESSPRHSRESSPRHSRESSPRHSRESSPRHSRESKHSLESSPKPSEECRISEASFKIDFDSCLQFLEECSPEADYYSPSLQKSSLKICPEERPQINKSSFESCNSLSQRSSPKQDPQLFPASIPSPNHASVPSLESHFQGIEQASSKDNLPAFPKSFSQDSVELSAQPTVKCRSSLSSSPQPNAKPNTKLCNQSNVTGGCKQHPKLQQRSTYNLRRKSTPVPRVSPHIEKPGLDSDVSSESEYNPTDDQSSCNMDSQDSLDEERQSAMNLGGSSALGSLSLQSGLKSTSSPLPNQNFSSTCDASLNPVPSQRLTVSKCHTTVGGKKILRQKKHLCLYCKKPFSKIARHLLRKHANEADVAQARSFRKGSKQRRLALQQIRDKGTYQHNIEVLRSGSGEIIAKKRPSGDYSVSDYLPCPHCLGFFLRHDLWRHQKTCKMKEADGKSYHGRIQRTSSKLVPSQSYVPGACESIISSMHTDDVLEHIKGDSLICAYGDWLMMRHGHDKKHHPYISQRLRELGRFMLAVKEVDQSVEHLKQVLTPSKFNLAVEGAKMICGCDKSSNRPQTPYLALKIAYSIRQTAEILIGESLNVDDAESLANLNEFLDLLETNWISCVKNCNMENPESTELESCMHIPSAASPMGQEVVIRESVMSEAGTITHCIEEADLLPDLSAETTSELTLQPTQNLTSGLLEPSLSNEPEENGDNNKCELNTDSVNQLENESITCSSHAEEPSVTSSKAPSVSHRKSLKSIETNSKFSSFSGIKATRRLRVRSSKSKKTSSKSRVVKTGKPVCIQTQKTKRQFCAYCKKTNTKISRHLKMKHAKEKDVAHAFSFPKGSKTRHVLLRQLCNKGYYEHNLQVRQSGTGEILPKRKLKINSSVNDFESCRHCQAFFKKTSLWRHELKCSMKKDDVKRVLQQRGPRTEKTFALNDCLSKGCRDIVEHMRNDEVSKQVNGDSLICKIGNQLYEKFGHQKHRYSYISQKMRELGRFMLAVKELDPTVEYVRQVCTEARFELALEAAKKIGMFEEDTNKLKYSVIVLKLGYSLKHVADIVLKEDTRDNESTAQAKGFIKRLETDWFSFVSSHSCTSESSGRRTSIDAIALVEDVMKLHRCLRLAEEQAKQELIENPSLDAWEKLCKCLLVTVALFNKRQKSVVDKMLLKNYMERTKEHSRKNCEMLTKLEESLIDKLILIESTCGEESPVPVLLTERMDSSMEVLRKYRETIGVPADNPYMFAQVKSSVHHGATKCLRDFAQNCGANKPEVLTAPRTHHRVATVFQILSFNDQEMLHVTNFVGNHSYTCQKLNENPQQLTELCKLLHAIERGTVPHIIRSSDTSKGSATAVGSIIRDAVCGETTKKGKRRAWSLEEQKAVKKQMAEYISLQKVPGKQDCVLCLMTEPDALKSRTWRDIKNYVHNTIQTNKRRKTPQQMEEEQTDSDSDEEDDSVDGSDDEPPPKRRSFRREPRHSVGDGSDSSSTSSKIHHVYGVKAWASWVQSRTQNSDEASALAVKTDVLQCSPAELADGLCSFISEVRRPNGQAYAPDSVYYLCLGIQQYLLENGRFENIFLDPLYGQFAADITRLLKDEENTMPPSGFLQSRVEESFLWESKQLGALSPFVLLNTLLFFNVKHLNLKTLDQHERLTFTNFSCCTRTTDQGTSSYLQVKLSANKDDKGEQVSVVLGKRKREDGEEEKEECMEMPANTADPLRCPVKLYQFYLSRCSDSVKQRPDVFYMQPEPSCDPSSPVWYSDEPLERTALDSMLTRILAVRDVHQDPRQQVSDSSPEESS